ncbi:hypothetical protein ACVOMV_32350 [Mesorhizobium atlanticum]
MARADSKDYTGAIADFDEALKLDPGNGDHARSPEGGGSGQRGARREHCQRGWFQSRRARTGHRRRRAG